MHRWHKVPRSDLNGNLKQILFKDRPKLPNLIWKSGFAEVKYASWGKQLSRGCLKSAET